MLIRFKYNTYGTEFNGTIAEYYITDTITDEQFDNLDHEIDKLLDEYSNNHNGDFIDCDYENIIEKAFKILDIKYNHVIADKIMYL